MRTASDLVLALKRLRHRPVRSLLLLQGTVWGVAVALFPSAVMQGTRKVAVEHAREMGADRITFAADPTTIDAAPLTTADVEAMRGAVATKGVEVRAAAGLSVRETRRKGAPDALPASVPDAVVAGPPEAPVARGLAYAAGRPLDPRAAAPEAVVEGLLAQALAPTPEGALGKALDLGDGTSAVVVGVLAPRAPAVRRANDQGFDTGHPMFRAVTQVLMVSLGVPAAADAWKRTDRCAYVLGGGDRVDWIYLRVPATEVRRAAKIAEESLLSRGRAPVVFWDALFQLLLARDLDRFKSIDLALFLACLVMGGVVMANVGLLAALRRAPEVAVHRVEGATRKDVVASFLFEGIVLAVVGVVVGSALACGLAELRVALDSKAGLTWTFPWGDAVVAAVVAVAVGAVASAVPAWRAARQDPVSGLVDE
jgi:hypothetical protein